MHNQNALSHFGVLGMHWGKRKAEPSKASVKRQIDRDEAEARKSDDHKQGRVLYNKPVSEMSNDEIMKLTRRINLEKQVRDIHPSTYKKGMGIVKDITAAGVTIAALYGLSQTPLAGKIIQTPLAKAIATRTAKAIKKARLARALADELAKVK